MWPTAIVAGIGTQVGVVFHFGVFQLIVWCVLVAWVCATGRMAIWRHRHPIIPPQKRAEDKLNEMRRNAWKN